MGVDMLKLSQPQPGCACLTLHRPEAMNALSTALRQALVQTLDELARDDSLRVLILTGAGKAFCAGLDLRELGRKALDIATPANDPVAALARFPWPVIGAINGAAITGGFELALACDILIASSAARFADTHGRVGVIPGWGLSQKLSRRIGMGRAKEMAFSGNFINADQAERWGLVNRVTAPQDLMPQALALAADIASALPEIIPPYKRLIDDGYALPLDQALQLELQTSARWAAQLQPEALEARLADVSARGRAQTG